jgi:quercetin dioxygenase-like cupin family protein
MRCLNAIKDDLHDYAEVVQRCATELVPSLPSNAVDFGAVRCHILHKSGSLQTELIRILPDSIIPPHNHPQADSMDLLLDGNVREFTIGDMRVTRFIKGIGLRIPRLVVHGGVSGTYGMLFLSCQKWSCPPSHIALSWVGAPISRTHERLLEVLDKQAA